MLILSKYQFLKRYKLSIATNLVTKNNKNSSNIKAVGVRELKHFLKSSHLEVDNQPNKYKVIIPNYNVGMTESYEHQVDAQPEVNQK